MLRQIMSPCRLRFQFLLLLCKSFAHVRRTSRRRNVSKLQRTAREVSDFSNSRSCVIVSEH
jgi:hypothetical protein